MAGAPVAGSPVSVLVVVVVVVVVVASGVVPAVLSVDTVELLPSGLQDVSALTATTTPRRKEIVFKDKKKYNRKPKYSYNWVIQ